MAKASITEQFDCLTAKLAQLEALLTVTYGNGAEFFNVMPDRSRDNYLRCCADMAAQCLALHAELAPCIYGDIRERFDRLENKLAQLEALLTATHGNQADSFNGIAARKRDNYLWCCADMAEGCAELATELAPFIYGRTETETAVHHG